MKMLIKRFIQEEDAMEAIQVAIIIGIAVVILAALREQLQGIWNNAKQSIENSKNNLTLTP